MPHRCWGLRIYFFIVTIVMAILINSSFMTHADQALDSQSTEIFLNLMNDTSVRSHFRNAQWDLLNLDVDAKFNRIFFSVHGIVGDLFQTLRVLHDNNLDKFSKNSRFSMVSLQTLYPDLYVEINEAIRDVAIAMGFPKKAIENREIYIASDLQMNAFTVSGNGDRIIVVLNAGLVERMGLLEIKGVLAHELGHIRSYHSVRGVFHNIFMSFIANQYQITSREGNAVGVGFNWRPFSHLEVNHNFFDEVEEEKKETQSSPFTDALEKLQTLPSEDKKNVILSYLTAIVEVMEAMLAPPSSIDYFKTILQTIENGTNNQLVLELESLKHHVQMAFEAASRAQEISADRYAVAVVSREAMSLAVAKILGIAFKKAKDGRLVIQGLNQQYDRIMGEIPHEELFQYVGTTHPAPIPRVAEVSRVPFYPFILFQDSNMRIFLLNDILVSRGKSDSKAKEVQETLEGSLFNNLREEILHSKDFYFDRLIVYYALNRQVVLMHLVSLEEELKESALSQEGREKINQEILVLTNFLNRKSSLIARLRDALLEQRQQETLKRKKREIINQKLALLEQVESEMNPDNLAKLWVDFISKGLSKEERKKVDGIIPRENYFVGSRDNPGRVCQALLSAIGSSSLFEKLQ